MNKLTLPFALAVLVCGLAASPSTSVADEINETDKTTLSELLTVVMDNNAQAGHAIGAGTDEVAATRVRKAFLKAKKAFHEARQEIQAIKKGDESPVKGLPTFFDENGDGDEVGEDTNDDEGGDDQVEDGYEVMPG